MTCFRLVTNLYNFTSNWKGFWNLDHLRICEKWSKMIKGRVWQIHRSILFGAMHRRFCFFASQTATNMKLLGSQKQHYFLDDLWFVFLLWKLMKDLSMIFQKQQKNTIPNLTKAVWSFSVVLWQTRYSKGTQVGLFLGQTSRQVRDKRNATLRRESLG